MTAKFTYHESFYIQNFKQALQSMDKCGSKIKIVAKDEYFYVSNILRIYSPMLSHLLDQSSVLGVPTLILPETTSHSVKLLVNLLKDGSVETGLNQDLCNIKSIWEVAKLFQINIQNVEIKVQKAFLNTEDLSRGSNELEVEIEEIQNCNSDNRTLDDISLELESFIDKSDRIIEDNTGSNNISMSGVRCPRCLKAFPQNTELISHLDNTLKKAVKSYECPVEDCKDCYFNDLHSLYKHRKKHKLEKKEFLRGMVKMTKNRHHQYVCPMSHCISTFPTLEYIIWHASRIHSMTEESLMVDVLNMSVCKDVRCPICKYVFKGCRSGEIISHGLRKHRLHPCNFYEKLISEDIKCSSDDVSKSFLWE